MKYVTKIVATTVVAVLVIMMLMSTVNVNIVDVYVEPEKPMVTVKPIVDEPTVPEEEEPIEFVYDTYIDREWSYNDYSSADVNAAKEPESFKFCVSYDFSNGFYIKDTKNLKSSNIFDTQAVLTGKESTLRITVSEEDALRTNIHTLRNELLISKGLQYYSNCNPLGIPLDTKEEYLLEHKEDYFETKDFLIDPLNSEAYLILCDDIIKTAFGNALYVEVKSLYSDTYQAYAFITCDRDRILNISIEDTTREYLYDSLLEVTNDGIVLIK